MDTFRPFVNPSTGETIQFIDDGPELVRFSWRSAPGGEIPEHFHPGQEERFAITSGEAHFTVEGQGRTVGAGESIVIPVGVPHSESNRGSVEVLGTVELRPGLQTRRFHEALGGLAGEGRTTAGGAPRNPLQLGATLWHFRHETRVTSPPPWLQNAILPALSALAGIFGMSAFHERWDTRTAGALSLEGETRAASDR